jgi:tRNA(Arg) A34 adenosine deaminase TadA
MFSGNENAHIWEKCLDLAIAGFNHGSMAIAALVVSEKMEIIGLGRNYLGEINNNGSIISNSSIAHAEINAIHSIQQESLSRNNLSIFTTVEPCPMCLGAIAMSRIRNIYIGSKDPHAGSVKYLNMNEYVSKKQIKCTFENGIIEKIFFAIHYLSICRIMKNKRSHVVFDNLKIVYKDNIDIIERHINKINIEEYKLDREKIKQLIR